MRGRLQNDDSGEVKPFLFKIHNGVESDRNVQIECQNAVLNHLSNDGFACSKPYKSLENKEIAHVNLTLKNGETKTHAVRLLFWVEGKTMNACEVTTEKLVRAGRYLGKLKQSLKSFDHEGAHRMHLWDTKNTHLIKPYIETIDEEEVRDVVTSVVNSYETEVIPISSSFEQGVL
jgi:Ser/Thr protein kinase RdoA (MazF antagonist)